MFKKLFLVGTALAIGTNVWAFGGMGLGVKSSSHKGGVSAIGVHIDTTGKKADIEISQNNCDEGTPCGTGCCQLDNVCHQDAETGEYQCCDKELTKCCSITQGIYIEQDWSMGYPPTLTKACCDGKAYSTIDVNGNVLGNPYCCPEGKILHGPIEMLNGDKDYVCCAPGEKLQVVAIYDNGKHYACCDAEVREGAGSNGTDLCCGGGYHGPCPDSN